MFFHAATAVDESVRIAAADRAGRERLLHYCARPPLALDRLRELDPERLVYDPPQRGPGGSGSLLLTPLELLDRLAALVQPPRLHRHRYFGASVRTTAHREFRWWPRPSLDGRSATVESKPEQLDRRRSQYTHSWHSTPRLGWREATGRTARLTDTQEQVDVAAKPVQPAAA